MTAATQEQIINGRKSSANEPASKPINKLVKPPKKGKLQDSKNIFSLCNFLFYIGVVEKVKEKQKKT